jgi:hypothetical protein
MTTHLALQRPMLPTAQVSALTTGSITLPSARGAALDEVYESIATVNLSGGTQNSIEFTSIPSTYKKLQVRGIARDNRSPAYSNATVRFNSDSGSNYFYVEWEGDPRPYISIGPTDNASGLIISQNGAGVSQYANFIIDIYDYANTNWHTSIIDRGVANRGATNGSNNSYGGYWLGAWKNTSVVSTITITPTTAPFAQYSHVGLYGVK